MIGLLIALALFAALNFAVIWSLLRLHPRRRAWVWGIAIFCNLFWGLLPMIFSARTSPLTRFARALLAPPWFSWMIFLIIYAFFLIVLALVWRIFFGRLSFHDAGHVPSTILLTILAILAVFGYYDATVPLRVERPAFAFATLDPALHGTKVAIVSDLHVGMFSRPWRLRKIFERVNQERPDVLVLTGDMIDDDPHFVPKLLDGLRFLDPSIPALAVLGNHEMYGDPRAVIRQMKGSRLRLLVNEGWSWERAGHGIWFAGISDYAAGGEQRRIPRDLAPNFDAAFKGKPPAHFPIVVAHQPEAIPDAFERGLPLTLCGHTHGGQLGSPPLGWSLAGVFLPYHMGSYHEGGSHAYVNTGTGYWVVPFRLGMTPEITIVRLEKK
jgi:predicted MPP superfamily phosphohydrolase